MATQNALNNQSTVVQTQIRDITIDPGASGDSYIQINSTGGGTSFRVGVDDDDADSFKIALGSALGTNDAMIMDVDGVITMPLQPLFIATINAEANATGANNNHAVGATTAVTERVDQNGDFTPGNGAGTGAIFTAPITGQYFFNFHMSLDSPASGAVLFTNSVTTSNRTLFVHQLATSNQITTFYGPGNDLMFGASVIGDMDAADTATFRVNGTGGSNTSTIVEGQISGGLVV